MSHPCSEEVFDFSKASLTSQKAQELKGTMTKEFASIFDLCDFVIDMYINTPQSIKPSLVKVTLKTLSAFMSWIPLGYIFETPMIMKLITHLLPQNHFRLETIKCLTEIAGLRQTASAQAYDQVGLEMFVRGIEKMEQIIQGVNLVEEYYRVSAKNQSGYESFCQQFAILLSTFLQNDLEVVDTTLANPAVSPEAITQLVAKTQQAFMFLIQLSNIPNDEVFKICVEFWNFLANRAYATVASELMQPTRTSVLNLQLSFSV